MNGYFGTHYFYVHGGNIKGFEFYVFTYVINFVALQLVARRWAKSSPRRVPSPVLIQNRLWTQRSTELWPNNGIPISWPPPQAISDETLYAFTYRWLSLSETGR